MATVYLKGWDADNNKWVKLVCNSDGKLIIDPSEILEDTPTNNEVGKAPTSNWAYDHNANASAHHTRYTDEEATDAWKERIATLTAGTYTAFDVEGVSLVNVDRSGAPVDLRGIANGYEGKIVIFICKSAGSSFIIRYNHAGAASTDKIYTSNNADQTIGAGNRGGVIMIYTNGAWRCLFNVI